MLDSPSPTHGFLPVILAFLGYIAPSFAATVSFLEAGVPTRLRVPLFRRLTPRLPETD